MSTRIRLGVLGDEFFDLNLGRMGGFGWACRQVAECFNSDPALGVEVIFLTGELFARTGQDETMVHCSRLVMFYDDDDRLRKRALAALVAPLLEEPTTVASVGATWRFVEWGDGVRIHHVAPRATRIVWPEVLFGWSAASGQNLYRTAVVRAVGGVPDLHFAQDRAMWLRVARCGPMVLIPDVVLAGAPDVGAAAGAPDQALGRLGKPRRRGIRGRRPCGGVALLHTRGGGRPRARALSADRTAPSVGDQEVALARYGMEERTLRLAVLVGEFPALSETFILNQITGLLERGHSIDIYAERRREESLTHPEVLRHGLSARTFYEEMPQSVLARLPGGVRRFWPGTAGSFGVRLRALNVLKYGLQAASLRLLYGVSPLLARGAAYDVLLGHFGANGLKGAYWRVLGATRAKRVTAFHGVDITAYPTRFRSSVYDLFLPISSR